MTTVPSPEEIFSLFSDTHDNFSAIIGKLSDDDVQRRSRRNFQALQDINPGDGNNSTGLILSKVDNNTANANQVFDPADGALEVYDPSIWDKDNNFIFLLQEKNWSRKIDLQAAIQTAERVGNKFVLSCVEETREVRLKHKTTVFKHVTLHDILNHLGATRT